MQPSHAGDRLGFLVGRTMAVVGLLILPTLTIHCGGHSEHGTADNAGADQGAGGSGGGGRAEGGAAGSDNNGGSIQGGSEITGSPAGTSGTADTGGTAIAGSGGDGSTGPCAPPLVECDGDCVDITSTADHCGGCGHRCGRATPCVSGTCGCPDGSVACAGVCVDPASDANNCGGCGLSCAGSAICFDSHCECPEGTLLCDGSCVSPNDPEHCGSCDQRCDSDEVCASGQCRADTLPCPADTVRCGSVCVDLLSTPAHCGSCNNACAGSQFCLDGECACPSGLRACGTTCEDVDSSPLNCGSCNNVCGVGQVCVDGECECSSPTAERCDGACVETATDINHCGGCGHACTSYPCTDGECRCPAGEQLCGGSCINTESDASSCGDCGAACPAGESCVLGECSNAVDDGCQNALARGISLHEIALYQAGKVQLMSEGGAVEPAQRAADVVAGKPGLLRAFVTLEPDWVDRVLSARLVVLNDDVEALFHKRTVAVSSTESSLATTFNFDLPGALIQPTTRYSIELVECQSGSGGAFSPRFPAGGTEPLQARGVGALKVELVPIVTNGNTPHTDAAHVDPLTDYLKSIYPIAELQVSIGPAMAAKRPLGPDFGWEQIVQQLSQQHEADDAPNDVYYYGLLEPEDTFEQFCIDNQCTLGIGYVTSANVNERHHRVSMGLSYADLYSAETMAHELGHNHGREHAPCGGPADPDPAYPYPGARLGWWGFIYPNQLLSPTSGVDIMSYCESPWISDYTYQGIMDRVVAVDSNASMLDRAPRGRFRVAVVARGGVTWGVPPMGEVEAAGAPEPAVVLDRAGNPLLQVTVYRMRMGRAGSASIMVPEPALGWYAVELQGQPPLAFGANQQSGP